MKKRSSTVVDAEGRIKKEDARVIRSKRDLADALEELLSQKNFDDITIKEISEKAMVSKLTFYNNFLDKNDLLMYLFHRYSEEIYEKVKVAIMAPSTLHQKYEQAVKMVVDFLTTRPIPLDKMIKNDTSKTVYWNLNKFIKEATIRVANIYGKMLNISVPPEILSYFYSGAFTNLIYSLALKNKKLENAQLVNYIMLLTFPEEEKVETKN